MDNVQEMLVRALDGFGQRVRAVADSQWAGSTPCDLWTVSDLVNHVVWILRWTPPLIAGTSPAEVGTAEACVHTWDLARSIGADETLDPGLVREVTDRYRTSPLYKGSAPGESWPALFNPPVTDTSDADPQSQLIMLVGRDPRTAAAG